MAYTVSKAGFLEAPCRAGSLVGLCRHATSSSTWWINPRGKESHLLDVAERPRIAQISAAFATAMLLLQQQCSDQRCFCNSNTDAAGSPAAFATATRLRLNPRLLAALDPRLLAALDPRLLAVLHTEARITCGSASPPNGWVVRRQLGRAFPAS
eukprot:354973-Chlamydomonas_euryale.AAC.10